MLLFDGDPEDFRQLDEVQLVEAVTNVVNRLHILANLIKKRIEPST
jgi:hypothetical protein